MRNRLFHLSLKGFIPALIFLPLIITGAGKHAGAAAKTADFAQLAKAPAKARAMHNPFSEDADAKAAGAKLFADHCAQCHGMSAGGGRRGPSLRVPAIEQAEPGELFWILSNGVVRRGMPDWSRLPEAERWQIVTYLMTPTGNAKGSAR